MRQKISDKLRASVLDRDGRVCQYCGKKGLYKQNYALDHILPIQSGGINTLSNLVVVCRPCNTRKGSKGLSDYIEKRLLDIARETEILRNIEKELNRGT
jgi:5-methylcytosine-specific restriction endonuclease McrA